MNYVIDVGDLIAKDEDSLVGYQNGVLIIGEICGRMEVILDDIEQRYDKIVIKIPERVNMISDTFIRGMFEKRLLKHGVDFLLKYEFEAQKHVQEKIYRSVNILLIAHRVCN